MLDKGLVIAGDIKINLANVELLTIQVRLLVCSIDKAEQIGLNWWRNDPRLTMANRRCACRRSDMEARLARIEETADAARATSTASASGEVAAQILIASIRSRSVPGP